MKRALNQHQLDNTFCLVEQENSLYLDHSHAYFQVQTQPFVCDVEYYDFCICTFASDQLQDELTLHIERV